MKSVTQLWPLETGVAGSEEQLGCLHSTGADRLQPELPWANPAWLLLVPHVRAPYLAAHPTKLEPEEHRCPVHLFPKTMLPSLRIGFQREWGFQGENRHCWGCCLGRCFCHPKYVSYFTSLSIMGLPGGKAPMHLEKVVKKETSRVTRCHDLPTVRKR